MNIEKYHIASGNIYSRIGWIRPSTKLIVVHYPAWPGASAERIRDYFDSVKKRYASSQYVIGLQGEIYELKPPDEVAWHCGAESYTTYMQTQYAEWTTNDAQRTPNWISVGIEACHEGVEGMWNAATLESLIWLCKQLLYDYGLETNSLLRHYDVTGKRCPSYYVEHPDKWARIKALVGGTA